MSEKKVVRYNASRGVFSISYITGRTQYVVFPIDHTSNQVTNGQSATTSKVVVPINQAGEFETLNSKYVPVFLPL